MLMLVFHNFTKLEHKNDFLCQSTYFLCSFSVSMFRLIVVFSSLCATAGDRCSIRPEKNERSVAVSFLFLFQIMFCPLSDTPYFSSVDTPSQFLFCRLVRCRRRGEAWWLVTADGLGQRPPVKASGASLYGHSRQQRTAGTTVTQLGCGCNGSTAAVQARNRGLLEMQCKLKQN